MKIETFVCGWTWSQLVEDNSQTFLSRLLAVSILVTLFFPCWNLLVSVFDELMSVVNILFVFLQRINYSFTGVQ